MHYAPSLIARIAKTPKQEIATHTFSHYYCQEPGETREAFAADIASAMAIGRRYGFDIRSIVFPRNQFRAGYESVLKEAGITCYRGNEPNWMYRPRPRGEETLAVRAPRLARRLHLVVGTKISFAGKKSRSRAVYTTCAPACFCDRIRRSERASSRYVCAASPAGFAPRQRIAGFFTFGGIRITSARTSPENIEFLRSVLKVFAEQRQVHGMQSLSMIEVASLAPAFVASESAPAREIPTELERVS